MTAKPPRQLALDLPVRTALGAEDFLISPVNAPAVEIIDRWPQWPAPAVLIHGEPGVGKSHLVAVWRTRSGARSVAYADLGEPALAALRDTGVLAVEDIDRADTAGAERSRERERLLFHLLNLARESRGTILLTSRLAAGDLGIGLPDLRSRLRALPAAAISAPDDALLGALLVKLFTDRQLMVEPQILSYLLNRMERSADAARRIVGRIDAEALARRSKVSKALVSAVLAEDGADVADGDDAAPDWN